MILMITAAAAAAIVKSSWQGSQQRSNIINRNSD
jgi:hypothetical protein